MLIKRGARATEIARETARLKSLLPYQGIATFPEIPFWTLDSLYPYPHIKAFTDSMIHIPGGYPISHKVDLIGQIIQFCK